MTEISASTLKQSRSDGFLTQNKENVGKNRIPFEKYLAPSSSVLLQQRITINNQTQIALPPSKRDVKFIKERAKLSSARAKNQPHGLCREKNKERGHGNQTATIIDKKPFDVSSSSFILDDLNSFAPFLPVYNDEFNGRNKMSSFEDFSQTENVFRRSIDPHDSLLFQPIPSLCPPPQDKNKKSIRRRSDSYSSASSCSSADDVFATGDDLNSFAPFLPVYNDEFNGRNDISNFEDFSQTENVFRHSLDPHDNILVQPIPSLCPPPRDKNKTSTRRRSDSYSSASSCSSADDIFPIDDSEPFEELTWPVDDLISNLLIEVSTVPNSRNNQRSFSQQSYPVDQMTLSKSPCGDFSQSYSFESFLCEELDGRPELNGRPNNQNFKIIHLDKHTNSEISPVGEQIPTYIQNEVIVHEISSKTCIALPFPLCRALILDSSSPVLKAWESSSRVFNFSKSPWSFPPDSCRPEYLNLPEHQLISFGAMVGAHRTISYDRVRNGEVERRVDTLTVDADDTEEVAVTITETTSRKGFSVQVKILIRAVSENACEATILAELRPIRLIKKQATVHKAFRLVTKEISMKYGTEGKGLLSAFLQLLKPKLPDDCSVRSQGSTSTVSQLSVSHDQCEVFLLEGSKAMELIPANSQAYDNEGSFQSSTQTENSSRSVSSVNLKPTQRRPSSLICDALPRNTRVSVPDEEQNIDSKDSHDSSKPGALAFADLAIENFYEENPIAPQTIEIKPLPKIRLDLLPAPREEDEEHSSSESESPSNSKSARIKKKSSKKKRPSKVCQL